VNYLTWKNWRSHAFGFYNASEHYYFKKLFNRHLDGCQNARSVKVLEVGFGNGNFLAWCLAHQIEYVGIDKEVELASRAKAMGILAFTDINCIPHEFRFDMVFMFDVLEHLSEDQIIEVLGYVSDRLEIGGRLVIRSPNGASPLGLNNQHGDPTHSTIVTTSKMEYWITQTQLVIENSGWDVYPFFEGEFFKVPTRLLRRFLQLLLEKIVRIIFSPQSAGIFSANLLIIVKKQGMRFHPN